jgi:hypothetical protein
VLTFAALVRVCCAAADRGRSVGSARASSLFAGPMLPRCILMEDEIIKMNDFTFNELVLLMIAYNVTRTIEDRLLIYPL